MFLRPGTVGMVGKDDGLRIRLTSLDPKELFHLVLLEGTVLYVFIIGLTNVIDPPPMTKEKNL